jgi:hypothetical protein
MMPFEWDVRVSSKDHTVTVSTSATTRTTTMRYTTMRDSTENLLDAGYLEEDPEELTISVSAAGRALLERNPEAAGRATSIHETQQFLSQALGSSIARPNSKSAPRL